MPNLVVNYIGTLGFESVHTLHLVVIQMRTETKQSSSLLDTFCRGVNTFKPKCMYYSHLWHTGTFILYAIFFMSNLLLYRVPPKNGQSSMLHNRCKQITISSVVTSICSNLEFPKCFSQIVIQDQDSVE